MRDQQPPQAAPDRGIAIVGMAGRFPGARDLRRFWDNLVQGVESVTFLTPQDLAAAGVPQEVIGDPSYVRAASLLDGPDEFDAEFFGYTPREAELLDPQQRLFMEHAWQALEDAGYAPGRTSGLIGVYAGVAWNTYLLCNLVSHRELFEGGGGFQVFISNDKDFLPTRVSYKLDLKGPSLVVQTSCSTSLVAVHLACLSLLNYECDLALAGGVTVRVPQKAGYHFLEGGLASPDGHCRTFDAAAAGTLFGSGVGVVVLKRLDEALADGDAIRAVIRGSAINNDGSVKVSYTAPSVEGQAEVIAAAQAIAGVEPDTISYVEAHGTATSLGDPIEVAALTKVFAAGTSRKQFCGLGSVKTNFGHLDAAAGIAGLLKTVLALQHRTLPPSLHFERPNPRIELESSPFYVVAEPRPWAGDGRPRRAGVSSFGVGGTNAHVVLEEAPEPAAASPSRPWQLLLLSARTPAALEQATAELALALAEEAAPELPDVAYTLQVGRTLFRQRRAVVVGDRADAVLALQGARPEQLSTALDVQEATARPVVFLFPGQGTQHAGAGAELYDLEATFRKEVDGCCRLFAPHVGFDLRELLLARDGRTPEAAARLTRTDVAQPALFVVEYALARQWMEWGIAPRAMMGHSIGEYVAACLAGVLSLDDALRLVAARGRLMQSCPPGAMVTVPLGEEALQPFLSPELVLAAVNAPERCVVAGAPGVVAALEERLSSAGVATRRLPVSHAFHSPLMDAILGEFRDAVRSVRLTAPRIPFVSNLTGAPITDQEATDPDYWVRHLRHTVRWADGTAALLRQEPGAVLLEAGPGTTLSNLARRHLAAPTAIASLPDRRAGEPEGSALLTALGRLWLAGCAIDWAGFYARERRRRVPLPTYPFERKRHWIEPHGATAPPRPAEEPAIKAADPAAWLYLPSWRRTLSPGARWNGRCRRFLLFVDEIGLGETLADGLRQVGQEVVTVRAGRGFGRAGEDGYTLDPGEAEEYEALLDELRAGAGRPEVVVHLWSVTGGRAAGGADALDAALRQGALSLLLLGRALAREGAPARLVAVADQAVSVTGGEPLVPEKATLLGMIRTLPQELPRLACRFVDVAVPEPLTAAGRAALAASLAAELAAGLDGEEPAAPAVALRLGERWEERFDLVPPAPDGGWRSALPEGGAILVADGLAGPGLAVARSMARELRPRLALLEAPGFPAPDGWQARAGEPAVAARIAAARELEEAAAEVRVLAVDITDEAAVRGAVAELRSAWGGLDAVVDAAALAEAGIFLPLADAGPEEVRRHVAAAARGALSLDRALAAEGVRPSLNLLLSSLAGVLGGLGYAAHAAASCFLDAFARASRRDGRRLPWTAVDLDAWQLAGGEGAPRRGRDLARLAMSEDETAEVVRRAAAAGSERIVVSTADLAARITRSVPRREAPLGEREAAPGDGQPRPALTTPYAPPETELEAVIARLWQSALGFEQVGVHDNFFELGGDSFLAVQVIAKLKAELGREVQVARLYQGLTIRALAALLAEEDTATAARRAAHLEERRGAMDRRHRFQEARRTLKAAQEDGR
jgi:acyl transferase domain-containing protein